MSNGPLVSTIIPTLGHKPEYLVAAVESVATQTDGNIEVVIVDDSPAAVSERIETREWDGLTAVRCIRDREHDGVSAARNAGIEAANGDILAFLDDDDYWYSTKIERQLAAFQEAPEWVGAVCCQVERVMDGETTSVCRPMATRNERGPGGPPGNDAHEASAAGASRKPRVSGDLTEFLLCGGTLCSLPSIIVDGDVVREHEVYFDEELDCWEDLDWYLRLSQHCEFTTVDDPLVAKREGEHDQLTDRFESIRETVHPRFSRKHRPLAAEYGPAIERKFVARLAIMLSSLAFANDDYGLARRQAFRSIRHNPRRTIAYLYFLASLGGKFTAEPLQALQRARSS